MASQGALHSGYNHTTTRSWQSTNTEITSKNLLYPLFITDEADALEEVSSLPGQYRMGINNLEKIVSPLVKKGLESVLLFGVLSRLNKKISSLFPDLLICCDVCICPYATHGHCGILNEDGSINNAASIKRIAEISLSYAKAGCHVVAPSDMMDNRIAAIKDILHKNGYGGKFPDLPLAIYQVSGEFAMLYHGSKAGAFDLKKIVLECLTSMRRA
ncbi:hypothetical protein pdam_00015997, partial [Pocillopora damicornis]